MVERKSLSPARCIRGAQPMSDEQRLVAKLIIDRPGITPREISLETGFLPTRVESIIRGLTYRYYLYEDEWKGTYRYYIEYEFDDITRIPETDLFGMIFGVPATEVLADLGRMPEKALVRNSEVVA